MEKLVSYFIVMGLSLLAVAIAYRVRGLHKLVFGKGSAHLNYVAEMSAASTPGAVS